MSTARRVSALNAIMLTHRVIVRQLITRGRVVALGLLGSGVVLVGWAVGRSDDTDLRVAVEVMINLGFTVVVPIVALVFAAAALGDTREDGTLVYLWLRPMARWPVVVGAFLAAVTVSIPITVVPLVATALVLGVGGGLVAATIVASVVGVIAYSAVFLLLGLMVKNSIVWGLGYILIWEGLVAGFGTFAARLAIRGYTGSIITDRTGIEIDVFELTAFNSIVVVLVAAVVALTLASWRLDRLDVA